MWNGFNPLDRVKFVQIVSKEGEELIRFVKSFNPLDRVKFVQILRLDLSSATAHVPFQSPRSGQICSNLDNDEEGVWQIG